jgi:hypothetical protein
VEAVVTAILDDFQKLKAFAERCGAEAEAAKGARGQLIKQLEEEFGIDSEGGAETEVKRLLEQEARLVEKYGKKLKTFDKELEELSRKLEEDDSPFADAVREMLEYRQRSNDE